MRFRYSLLAAAVIALNCSNQSFATTEQGTNQEEVQLGTKWYEVTPNGLRLLKQKVPQEIPEDVRKSLLNKIDQFIKDEDKAMSRLASKAAPTELLNACQARIAAAKRERIWLQLPEPTRLLLAKKESLAEDHPETEDARKTHARALKSLQEEIKSNASQLNEKQKKMLSEWQQLWKLHPSTNHAKVD